jgi:hypothetical protein
MNQFEQMQEKLKQKYPTAKTEISKPVLENGFWVFDVIHGDKAVTVQWSLARVFGVSDISKGTDIGYGEGPDKVLNNWKEVEDYIVTTLEGSKQ